MADWRGLLSTASRRRPAGGDSGSMGQGYDFKTADSATEIARDTQESWDRASTAIGGAIEAKRRAQQKEDVAVAKELADQQADQAKTLQKNKMQAFEAVAEGKANEAKLADRVEKDADVVAGKEEKASEVARREAEKYAAAVESARQRQESLKQMRALREANQITQDQWADFQARMDEDAIDSRIAKEKDDASEEKMYGKAKSEVLAEFRYKEGRAPVEGEIDDAEIRAKMDKLRGDHPYWRVDPATGEWSMDDTLRRQELKNERQRRPPTQRDQITDEEIERAGEVRYTMPEKLRNWGPRMWEFNLGAEGGQQMAAESERQAARAAARQASPASDTTAASGRTAPVPTSARTSGIGEGSARPAAPKENQKSRVYPGGGVGAGAAQATSPAPTSAGPAPQPAPAPAPSASAWNPQAVVGAVAQGMPGTTGTIPAPPTYAQRAASLQVGHPLDASLPVSVGGAPGAIAPLNPADPLRRGPAVAPVAPMTTDQLRQQAASAAMESTPLSPQVELDRGVEQASQAGWTAAGNVVDAPRLAFQRAVAAVAAPNSGMSELTVDDWWKLTKSGEAIPRDADPAAIAGEAVGDLVTGWGIGTQNAKLISQAVEVGMQMLDPTNLVGGLGKTGLAIDRAMMVSGLPLLVKGTLEGGQQLAEVAKNGDLFEMTQNGMQLSDAGKEALIAAGLPVAMLGVISRGMGKGQGAEIRAQEDGVAQAKALTDLNAIRDNVTRAQDIERIATAGQNRPQVGSAAPTGVEAPVVPGLLGLDELAAKPQAGATAEPMPASRPDLSRGAADLMRGAPEQAAAARADSEVPAAKPREQMARDQAVIDRIKQMLPTAKVTENEDGSFDFSVGKKGKKVRVAVGVDTVDISAADVSAGHGVLSAGRQVAGGYTPAGHKQSLQLGVDGLIEVATGRGARTAGHELLHFFADNGMVSAKDWAKVQSRAAVEAAKGSDWRDLNPEQRQARVEEHIADAFGDYAAARTAARGADVPGPAPFRQAWDAARDFYRAIKGGEDFAFDKLLEGQFAGEERIGTRAGERLRSALGAERGAETFADLGVTKKAALDPEDRRTPGWLRPVQASGGFKGEHNPKTGTLSFRGPAGEKVTGRADGSDALKITTVNKGKAANPGTMLDMIRDLRKTQGKERIILDSKEGYTTTPDAMRMRDNFVKRGEGERLPDGTFLIYNERRAPGDLAKKASLEMKHTGEVTSPEMAAENRDYTVATLDRLAGRPVKGNIGGRPEGPQQKRFVLGQRDGKTVVIGKLTPDEHFERTAEWLGGKDSAEFKAAETWYEDLRGSFEEEFGKKNADKYLAMWAASQQQASPSAGLVNVFKAEDIAKGFAKDMIGKQAGLGHERLLAFAKDQAASLGQKLADFADSTKGKLTRSWVGDDPRGLKPVAFDLWMVRDRGYVDAATRNWVEKTYGKKAASRLKVTHSDRVKDGKGGYTETDAAPTAAEYTEGLKYYNDLADVYSQKLGHRVEPHQVQAMAWVAFQKMMGKSPESVGELFGKNKFSTAAEVRPGLDGPDKASFDALDDAGKARVTRKAFDAVLPSVAKATGVRISNRTDSVGRYEGDLTPNAVFDVMGSPDQVSGFADALAKATDQWEVWSLKRWPNKTGHNAVVVDVTSAKSLTPKTAEALFAKLKAAGVDSPGYSIVDGKLRLIVTPEAVAATKTAERAGKFYGKGQQGPIVPSEPTKAIGDATLEKLQADVQFKLAAIKDPTLSADVYGSQLVRGKGVGNEGPIRRVDGGAEDLADLRGIFRDAYGKAIREGGGTGPRGGGEPDGGGGGGVAKKASLGSDLAAKAGKLVGGEESEATWGDNWRRATLPILDRLRELKSVDTGRPIGTKIADAMVDARVEGERNAAKQTATFNRALDAFNRVAGKEKKGDWQRVVKALDATIDPATGKVELRYPDLKPHEKSLYTITRAILNTVRNEARFVDVFSGQTIRNYFPHYFADAKVLDVDRMAEKHKDWMQTDPEGQKVLAKLRADEAKWLGVMGPASDLELAKIDLARNFDREGGLARKSGHLERERLGSKAAIRTDPDVLARYLQESYRRIEQAKQFGPKSEVAKLGLSQLSKKDRQFALEAVQQFMGTEPGSGRGGTVGKSVAKNINAMMGLTKLGLASIAQISQGSVTAAHLVGRQGPLRGVTNLAKAAVATLNPLTHGGVKEDAARAASTFGSDSAEVATRWAGEPDALFTRIVRKLTPTRWAKENLVDGVWGVTRVDKLMRQVADRAGRYMYLDAVEKGDVALLAEMLDSAREAQNAITYDKPNVAALRKALSKGQLGAVTVGSSPAGSTIGVRPGVDRMDRAAKSLADRTQYRTSKENAPMAFQNPAMQSFNTFLSFMYQHWRWNATESTKAVDALKSGDYKKAQRHIGTLVAYHALFAPVFGASAMAIRSAVTGRGSEEENLEGKTDFGKLMAALGTRQIDGRNAKGIERLLEVLQAWQFAGGLGYMGSIAERGYRALAAGEERDTGRAAANLLGAPAGMGYDALAAARAVEAWREKKADGTATTKDYNAMMKALIDASAHVMPGPLGTGSAIRAQAKEKLAGGRDVPYWWDLAQDGDATWSREEGVSTPKSRKEKQSRAAAEMQAQARARIRAKIDAKRNLAKRPVR